MLTAATLYYWTQITLWLHIHH